MSMEEAAYVEPLAFGLHSCVLGDVKLGSKVLILGSGNFSLGFYSNNDYNSKKKNSHNIVKDHILMLKSNFMLTFVWLLAVLFTSTLKL